MLKYCLNLTFNVSLENEQVLSETGVKLSVSPVNQTCLLANWSLIEEDLDDILDCVNSFRIKLNSPVVFNICISSLFKKLNIFLMSSNRIQLIIK